MTPSPEQFEAALWNGVQVQFLAERKVDDSVMGLALAYNTDFRHGFTHMAVILHPAFHRKAWPLEVGSLFIDYLFSTLDLRKIYAETLDFNYPQIRSGAEKLFVEEGLLLEHSYYNGRYWDLRITALYREDWINRDRRTMAFLRAAVDEPIAAR